MKIPTLLFLAIVSLPAIVSSQDYGEVYCGRRLSSALALLCDNNLIKRSEVHQSITSDMNWPWLAPHRAHGLGGHRNKRQVVSECCDKPCTINELRSYCAY